MSSRTILMTGATGYLGSTLLREIVRDTDDRIVVLKRSTSDLRWIADSLHACTCYDVDAGGLRRAFDEQAIDIVVHLATHYGRANARLSSVIDTNLVFPQQLLEAAVERRVKTFVNTHTRLPPATSPYALSKCQFVEWLRGAAATTTCVNIPLEHFYGPHDRNSNFVSFVIQELLKQAPELRLTEGMQRRDFIYVDDVVSAYRLLLETSPTWRPGFYEYEIGTGEAITVRDLVCLLKDLTGNRVTQLRFGAIPCRANEVMESIAHIEPLCKLGWTPQETILSGLKRTLQLQRQENRVA